MREFRVGRPAGQQVGGGVVEGAEHRGDVPQRGLRFAPFGDRLGRLALEVQQDPAVRGAHGLAEVQVAVDPLDRQAVRMGVGHLAEGRAEGAPVAHQPRDGGDRAVQPVGHRGGQLPGLPPVQPGHRHRPGEHPVDLGGGPAEPVRLDREVAGGGVALQSADLVEGELPAVLGLREVALEQPEGGRLGAFQPALEPGGDPGDAGRTGPGEREREFQVGVGAGVDAAEQLQDVRGAVDDGAVGLFGGGGAPGQVGGQPGTGGAAERQRSEPVAGGQVLQQPPGQLGVVHRVDQRRPVVRALGEPAEDGGRLDAGRALRADAEQQLVQVAVRHTGGGGVLDPEQQVQQGGVADLEGGADHGGQAGDRTPLPGVPALGG